MALQIIGLYLSPRRFLAGRIFVKDTLNRLGISEEHYDCRTKAYYRIAEKWYKEKIYPIFPDTS